MWPVGFVSIPMVLFTTHLHFKQATLAAQLVKNMTTMRDLGSIPGLGNPPGEGKGYLLQYSSLENSMHGIVHGIAESWTRLSHFHSHLHHLYCSVASLFLFNCNLGVFPASTLFLV